MKEQYVGDVNDFRKYVLLRALAASDLKLGVNWMLTPPDTRRDGRKVGYLNQPMLWRHYDPELFDLLHQLVIVEGTRSVSKIEASEIVAGATYFNGIIPNAASARAEQMAIASTALSAADMVFYDPDNGLDVSSVRNGARNSSKYLYRDEMASAFAGGQSVLLYQHFPRRKRLEFTRGLIQQIEELTASRLVRALVGPYALFLLLGQDRHNEQISSALRHAVAWAIPPFRVVCV